MAGLNHALALNKSLDQRARERFTSSMRAWVLTDLAAQMQADYEQASIDAGESHHSGEAVHQFLKERGLFKWYSSLRCATQELVWQSVLRAIESDPDSVPRSDPPSLSDLPNAFLSISGPWRGSSRESARVSLK